MIDHLTTYEIALLLVNMPEGMSAAQRGRVIDKSKTYVNTMLRTWAGATETLKEAWKHEQIPYDLVKDLATEDVDSQIAAVQRYLELTLGTTSKKARGAARKEIKRGNETEKSTGAGDSSAPASDHHETSAHDRST